MPTRVNNITVKITKQQLIEILNEAELGIKKDCKIHISGPNSDINSIYFNWIEEKDI